MSPRTVTVLLRRVVDGQYDIRKLRNECSRLKAHTKIRDAIVSHLMNRGSIMPDVNGIYNWSCIQNQVPELGSGAYVKRWGKIFMAMTKKDEVPSNFLEQIEAACNKQQKIRVQKMLV